MPPITNRVGIHPPLDALALHLLQRSAEDVVARLSDLHLGDDNVLGAIAFAQAVDETLGDVGFRLAGAKHVGQVLGVGVEAQGGEAKVDVQHVAVVDDFVILLGVVEG